MRLPGRPGAPVLHRRGSGPAVRRLPGVRAERDLRRWDRLPPEPGSGSRPSGVADVALRVLAPSVVALPDGRWRMYVEARGPARRSDGHPKRRLQDRWPRVHLEAGVRLAAGDGVGAPRFTWLPDGAGLLTCWVAETERDAPEVARGGCTTSSAPDARWAHVRRRNPVIGCGAARPRSRPASPPPRSCRPPRRRTLGRWSTPAGRTAGPGRRAGPPDHDPGAVASGASADFAARLDRVGHIRLPIARPCWRPRPTAAGYGRAGCHHRGRRVRRRRPRCSPRRGHVAPAPAGRSASHVLRGLRPQGRLAGGQRHLGRHDRRGVTAGAPVDESRTEHRRPQSGPDPAPRGGARDRRRTRALRATSGRCAPGGAGHRARGQARAPPTAVLRTIRWPALGAPARSAVATGIRPDAERRRSRTTRRAPDARPDAASLGYRCGDVVVPAPPASLSATEGPWTSRSPSSPPRASWTESGGPPRGCGTAHRGTRRSGPSGGGARSGHPMAQRRRRTTTATRRSCQAWSTGTPTWWRRATGRAGTYRRGGRGVPAAARRRQRGRRAPLRASPRSGRTARRAGSRSPSATPSSEGPCPGRGWSICGRPVTITGGHLHFFGGEADGVDGARRVVRGLLKEGADFIKIVASGGSTRSSHMYRAGVDAVESSRRSSRRRIAESASPPRTSCPMTASPTAWARAWTCSSTARCTTRRGSTTTGRTWPTGSCRAGSGSTQRCRTSAPGSVLPRPCSRERRADAGRAGRVRCQQPDVRPQARHGAPDARRGREG